jgi:ubiquinone biosynthesis protein UbiJ
MLPEAAEAIRIADKHLAGESIERRKALALDIQETIVRLAGDIAAEAISTALRTKRY